MKLNHPQRQKFTKISFVEMEFPLGDDNHQQE